MTADRKIHGGFEQARSRPDSQPPIGNPALMAGSGQDKKARAFWSNAMDESAQMTVRPNGRFTPASQLDFSRYAKNLAWLLDIKVQAAQELLSRIYGYEHLHELQQALKAGGVPGPHWDEGPSDKNHGGSDLNLLCGMPGERSLAPVNVLMEWKRKVEKRPSLTHRECLIAELGLTDSPESHRQCVKRVKAFLEGEQSIDERGFPCGLWGMFAGVAWDRIDEIDTQSLASITSRSGPGRLWLHEAPPFALQDQLRFVMRDRATDALSVLTEKLEFGNKDKGRKHFFDEPPGLWVSMWEHLDELQAWDEPWEVGCIKAVFGEALESSMDEQYERFEQFVRWPSAKSLRECGVDLKPKDAIEAVSRWRFAWMQSAAIAWRSSVKKVLRVEAVGRNKNGFWTEDGGRLDLIIKGRDLYDSGAMELFDVIGTVSVPDETGKLQAIACLQGWNFVPRKDGYYASEESIDEFMGESEYLSLGWDVATRYMAIRGLVGMKKWTNTDEGCGVLVAKLVMAPRHETDEWVSRCIGLLTRALNDGEIGLTTSDDAFWCDRLFGDDVQQDDEGLVIEAPGLVVISVDGLKEVGMLIANEDDEGEQIIVSRPDEDRMGWGRRSGLRRRHSEPSRARLILEGIEEARIDVAIFDAEVQVGGRRTSDPRRWVSGGKRYRDTSK
jgi:hypothetical protein